MILSLVLMTVISCTTTEYRFAEIPAFSVPLPTPKPLVEVPHDDSAIFALTMNLSLLDEYCEKLEQYIASEKTYYENLSQIVFK